MDSRLVKFLILFIDFFVRYSLAIRDYIDNQFLRVKSLLCEGKYIQLAVYDVPTRKLLWLYNYDNIFYFIFIWLDSMIFNMFVPNYLFPYGEIIRVLNDDSVLIGSYIKGGKQFYEFRSSLEEGDAPPVSTTFLYCVYANHYDLTNEFNLFKSSLMHNTTLKCKNVLDIICFFMRKRITVTDEDEFKIVLDDTFTELTFKTNDILFLNHGCKGAVSE